MSIRRKLIKDIVNKLINESGCNNAPVDVEAIAKTNNTTLHKQSVDDSFSGYLFRDVRLSSGVIGINADHHPNRQRFTIAHELGHFLLHSGEDVHIDQQFVMLRRDVKSSEGTNEEEMEANLFAAELLMPEEFLAEDIRGFDFLDHVDESRISELAKKYRVSSQAMTIRLTTLGYL